MLTPDDRATSTVTSLVVTAFGTGASDFTTTARHDGTPSKPWYCDTCRKWWQTVRYNVSCCVYHPDGHCHYNDRECEKPEGITPLTDIDFGSFA